MAKNTRTEKDFLGKIQVPSKAYYGAHTARAKKNFQISGLHAPAVFREALGLVKLAAVETNISLKLISKKEGNAITKACKEFIEGKLNNDFDLDVFQAGAGTPFNMNANEVIANRANEILKGKRGEYKYVHPNNHVNMAQSSNDVIPTVVRLSALFMLPALLKELSDLEKTFGEKQKQYADIPKVGRTHLQDAVPITFGQEFDSYKQALQKSREFIEQQSQNLQIIGLGGTAVGTGINTDPKYKEKVIANLSKLTGIQFEKTKNSTEIANNMNTFMNFSASLRSLAVNIMNISLDLKLMSSGPKNRTP